MNDVLGTINSLATDILVPLGILDLIHMLIIFPVISDHMILSETRC